MREACPARDLVLHCRGKPLGQFWCCLALHAGLSPLYLAFAEDYAPEVPEVLQEAQGHHRSASVSACVKRYSRDDINRQLSCPRREVAKLRDGWRPYVPVDIGLGRVDAAISEAHVPVVPEVDEEAEPGELLSNIDAESMDAGAAADPATDSEWDLRASRRLADLADLEGSACAHKSVWCSKLGTWVLACPTITAQEAV